MHGNPSYTLHLCIPVSDFFQFWELISEEHCIDASGIYYGDQQLREDKLDVYYRQSASGKYVPRAILTDLEDVVIDNIQTGPLKDLFRPNNFIHGSSSSANIYAKGYYTDGAELCDKILETLRKEAEECDLIQGIQIMHSLGGGTGSGLGALMMMKIEEEYPDKMLATFTVYPSPKVSESIALLI